MTVFVSNWGIHMSLTLCLIRSMFQQDLFAPPPARRTIGIPDIVRTIAEHSARPRYTFMVLDLISRVARRSESKSWSACRRRLHPIHKPKEPIHMKQTRIKLLLVAALLATAQLATAQTYTDKPEIGRAHV